MDDASRRVGANGRLSRVQPTRFHFSVRTMGSPSKAAVSRRMVSSSPTTLIFRVKTCPTFSGDSAPTRARGDCAEGVVDLVGAKIGVVSAAGAAVVRHRAQGFGLGRGPAVPLHELGREMAPSVKIHERDRIGAERGVDAAFTRARMIHPGEQLPGPRPAPLKAVYSRASAIGSVLTLFSEPPKRSPSCKAHADEADCPYPTGDEGSPRSGPWKNRGAPSACGIGCSRPS
jgi:hypothetical protein